MYLTSTLHVLISKELLEFVKSQELMSTGSTHLIKHQRMLLVTSPGWTATGSQIRVILQHEIICITGTRQHARE